MRGRADDHDPVGEPGQQQVGEREVAEVVGGEVQLDAVRRACRTAAPARPALLTSTSTGPTSAAKARTDDRSATSSSRTSTSPCIWSAAASPLSRLRTASTTWAPRSASALAVSGPMPPLAPVTTNRRPSWRGTSCQGSPSHQAGCAASASSTVRPSTYATGSPRVTVRPTVQSRSWICWRVRGSDLAGRVAVLALGEGDVEGHRELDQVGAVLVAHLVALGAGRERLERRALAR